MVVEPAVNWSRTLMEGRAMSEQSTSGTDRCSSCGQTSDETNLGYSEAREDLVCSRCVAFLGEHGYYPDEDGPERSVTVEYEVSEL